LKKKKGKLEEKIELIERRLNSEERFKTH